MLKAFSQNTAVFKTAALNHSAISPRVRIPMKLKRKAQVPSSAGKPQ
jgi:hypothetical protein